MARNRFTRPFEPADEPVDLGAIGPDEKAAPEPEKALPAFSADQPADLDGPRLPMHDGTLLAWPNGSQARQVLEALRGRGRFRADYPGRDHSVFVTHPDDANIVARY